MFGGHGLGARIRKHQLITDPTTVYSYFTILQGPAWVISTAIPPSNTIHLNKATLFVKDREYHFDLFLQIRYDSPFSFSVNNAVALYNRHVQGYIAAATYTRNMQAGTNSDASQITIDRSDAVDGENYVKASFTAYV